MWVLHAAFQGNSILPALRHPPHDILNHAVAGLKRALRQVPVLSRPVMPCLELFKKAFESAGVGHIKKQKHSTDRRADGDQDNRKH